VSGGPRIAPLPPEEWGDDQIDALRAPFGDAAATAMAATGPDATHVPNVLTTLLRHPKLTGPFLAFNAVLLARPTIEPRWRELMILRVAWRTRSEYEWIQHVRMARQVGISDEEIAAVGLGPSATPWSSFERDLLSATDQMLDHYRVDDATWTRLAAQLDEPQLLELTFVVGTYTALAMVFNSAGLELDPDLADVAAPPIPEAGG
jgi:alkylhydroperoxidase family enzyme